MAKLKATPDIVIVDPDVGQTSAPTTVTYEKERDEELWDRMPGAGWMERNVHLLTGLGDIADRQGSYAISLRPGDSYEAGIFQRGHGPTTSDPIKLADIVVFGLLKRPHDRQLITDETFDFGGTWCFHHVHTKVPTNIVSLAASRTPPKIDADGIPHPVVPDGSLSPAPAMGIDHKHQISPIFPGNLYFASVVVVDKNGNWDVRQRQFTALRRSFTVKFPKITVFNDGDPMGHGEGEFWFRVYTGAVNMPVVVEDFHQATMDIDDWSETGRPYTMGFAHIGSPQIVKPEEMQVSVSSWAVEHDGFLESDEGAGSTLQDSLPFPVGPMIENANGALTLDCPVSTTDDDFHYSADVEWTVFYAP